MTFFLQHSAHSFLFLPVNDAMNAFLCQLQMSLIEYTGVNTQIKRKNVHVCIDLYLLSDYNEGVNEGCTAFESH